jgi:AraC-like DNA-binding protein
MNKYRIAEALEILKDDSKDLSIIQVAYEVGFNNKVTFNKSFKKHVSQTPSQYLLSLRA